MRGSLGNGDWASATGSDDLGQGKPVEPCRCGVEVVTARGRLVRQLRAAGDRQTAARVAAVRRPTVSVWGANRLAGAAPNALAEMVEAGSALVQAQQDARASTPEAARALRRPAAQQRAANARLTQ
jgi:hypothetical protein